MKITAITKGIPMEASFDTAVSYLANGAVLIAGFAAAHNGLKLIKMQDSALANAGLGVAALIGAAFVKNPFVQIGLIAMAGFSLTKAAVLATKSVVAPGAAGLGGVTGFIAGLVPESLKAHINNALPSLGNSDYDSINGYPGDGYSGAGDINLDEHVGDVNPLLGADSDSMSLLGM